MLDGVDRLPATPNEQAHVLSLHTSGEHPVGLLHAHVHVEADAVHNLLEQLPQHGGLILLLLPYTLGLTHRRLPERFFFLRGGLGGALPVTAPAPASAGSSLGPFATGLPFGDAFLSPSGGPTPL